MIRHRSRPLPSLEELRAAFTYDAETGVITAKARRCLKRRAGTTADYGQSAGYRMVTFQSKHWLVHRIAWYMHYGVAPTFDIDHIDRDRSNNRIANLRQVDVSQNHRNCGPRPQNRCGVKGVSTHKDGGYVARIGINNKKVYLGYYATIAEAASKYRAAYLAAEVQR